MELISKEEAMRLVKEDLDASISRGDDERAKACLLHYIEISNLPTVEERKEGEWIPVGKEYPRDNQEVLITVDDFGKRRVQQVRFTFNLHEFDSYDFGGEEYKREGFYDYDSEWGYYEIFNVLAWMPLPEPYGERRE